ncbi:hypothetical protein ROP_04210 [Rhodococcus opacus B4]|uniref:Uncharacterized protein n=1 Tax=Rhodococcus opacus (strain B4) TaxID=632772 RepID=C1ARJ1_RHOOB|nr:hypothetical protein ROP_04210 [Rhodococcus opacus B4]
MEWSVARVAGDDRDTAGPSAAADRGSSGSGYRPSLESAPNPTPRRAVRQLRCLRLRSHRRSTFCDRRSRYRGARTLYCPPNEEHWHGAGTDSFMEHLAMLDNADDPATTTTWLEHVTDDEYLAE